MTHIIEPAASGRAKCRGCGELIAKGEHRFGERLPNPFADGDMTIWFHIDCALLKRPESLATLLDQALPHSTYTENAKQLIELCEAHHRLPRICGLEQAPSARAKCRCCQEAIAKDGWRIKLNFFEDGMFNAAGNIHVSCANEYFETDQYLTHLKAFADAETWAAFNNDV